MQVNKLNTNQKSKQRWLLKEEVSFVNKLGHFNFSDNWFVLNILEWGHFN